MRRHDPLEGASFEASSPEKPASLPQRSTEATVAIETRRMHGSRNLMETAMTSNRAGKCFAYAIATSLALGAAAAIAADHSGSGAANMPATSNEPAKIVLADNGFAAAMPMQDAVSEKSYSNPMERGVRAAAAQGPTELRRYVHRTQGIYTFSYWEFARYLPAGEQ